MVDPTSSAPSTSIEETSDLGKGDAATWAYWMGQEAIADKEEKKWHEQGDKIVKRFRDERAESNTDHKFNILWSNVKTLMPTLYARTPKPDVDRRFKDNATPAARYAAILLQRCLAYACDTANFDGVMKPAVQDRLLPGRGVVRVLYVPHYGDKIKAPSIAPDSAPALAPEAAPQQGQEPVPEALGSPQVEADEQASWKDSGDPDAVVDGGGDQKAENAEREVVYEEGKLKYVFWKDYREGPARQWDEVPWIRYRSFLTRAELRERFGEDKAKRVTLDHTPDGHQEDEKNKVPGDMFKKATVFEFWDRANRKVCWLAPETPNLILDEQDDPLGLPEFFPSPDPLLATTTTDTRIPVPDYVEYQDQANKLDKLTKRIDKLTEALKVVGVYPGEEKATLTTLLDLPDGKLVPVHDWGNWSDKGGSEGIIQWVPIKQIAEVLIQLYDAFEKTKAVLYELTGIGDIMRGMTSPDETLGAQELKSVFATRRITPEQKEVARFARDLLRLMGGIIAGHFSDKTISLITGFPQLAPVPQLPPPPQAQPQVQLELAIHQAAQQAQQQQQQQNGAPAAAGPVPATPMGGGSDQPASSGPGAAPQLPQLPPLSPQAQQFMAQQAQYQQMQQQVQAVQQANQQKQAEFAAACTLIREDGVHGFKIDIEADSTIAPDEQAEKAARTEFLGKAVPLLENLVPLSMGNPPMANLAKELFMFGARGFPIARSLEETIENAFDAIAKMPPMPPPGASKSAGKQGPTPQEIQLREKEIQSREQIAREQNFVKLQNIEQDRQADAEKLAAQDAHNRANLQLQAARGAKQDALAGARLTHIEARDAGMLT